MKKKRTKKQISLDGLEQFLNRRAKYMRVKKTKWEQILFVFLKDLHYNFKCQVPIICRQQYGYILDFLLLDYNLIIEVDSKQYHSSKEDVKKDNQRSRRLKKEGYHIIRFWNRQLAVFTKETVDTIIKQKIESIKRLKNDG